MSILFIPGWYPNRTGLTLGNFIQKHAEAAAPYAEVTVVNACADERLINAEYEVIVSQENGVNVIQVYYKKVLSGNGFFSSLKKLKRNLKAHLIGYRKMAEAGGKPDLLHMNILNKAGLICFYLKLRYGLNYVYTEHWTGFLEENPLFKPYSLTGSIYRMIAGRSKMILPVTVNLKNALIRNGIKGRFRIIGNVVDTDLFKPNTETKTETGDPAKSSFRFIHISHAFDEQKNISGILRAVEKLKNIRPDFILQIISDGVTDQHKTYAEELGILDKQVYFEGTKSTKEVAHELGKAQCLVLFSNYENLPCVIPEAMACGVPILSSNVGGIAEHVSPEMGILVSPRNDNELAMAMKKMMEQYASFSQQKLRAYSVRNFSYDQIGLALKEVYSEFVNISDSK